MNAQQVILRLGSTDASVFYIDPRMKEIVETRRKEKGIGAIRKDHKSSETQGVRSCNQTSAKIRKIG